MKQLITAFILTTTISAQAAETYLSCTINGQSGKTLAMMVDPDNGVGDNGFGAIRQASGASSLLKAGTEYVLKDKLGLVIRINRQDLVWTNDDPIIKLGGQCQKVAAPKNQI